MAASSQGFDRVQRDRLLGVQSLLGGAEQEVRSAVIDAIPGLVAAVQRDRAVPRRTPRSQQLLLENRPLHAGQRSTPQTRTIMQRNIANYMGEEFSHPSMSALRPKSASPAKHSRERKRATVADKRAITALALSPRHIPSSAERGAPEWSWRRPPSAPLDYLDRRLESDRTPKLKTTMLLAALSEGAPTSEGICFELIELCHPKLRPASDSLSFSIQMLCRDCASQLYRWRCLLLATESALPVPAGAASRRGHEHT